jgi:hypothetical protein
MVTITSRGDGSIAAALSRHASSIGPAQWAVITRLKSSGRGTDSEFTSFAPSAPAQNHGTICVVVRHDLSQSSGERFLSCHEGKQLLFFA